MMVVKIAARDGRAAEQKTEQEGTVTAQLAHMPPCTLRDAYWLRSYNGPGGPGRLVRANSEPAAMHRKPTDSLRRLRYHASGAMSRSPASICVLIQPVNLIPPESPPPSLDRPSRHSESELVTVVKRRAGYHQTLPRAQPPAVPGSQSPCSERAHGPERTGPGDSGCLAFTASATLLASRPCGLAPATFWSLIRLRGGTSRVSSEGCDSGRGGLPQQLVQGPLPPKSPPSHQLRPLPGPHPCHPPPYCCHPEHPLHHRRPSTYPCRSPCHRRPHPPPSAMLRDNVASPLSPSFAPYHFFFSRNSSDSRQRPGSHRVRARHPAGWCAPPQPRAAGRAARRPS
jgi:hypothetical protein